MVQIFILLSTFLISRFCPLHFQTSLFCQAQPQILFPRCLFAKIWINVEKIKCQFLTNYIHLRYGVYVDSFVVIVCVWRNFGMLLLTLFRIYQFSIYQTIFEKTFNYVLPVKNKKSHMIISSYVHFILLAFYYHFYHN